MARPLWDAGRDILAAMHDTRPHLPSGGRPEGSRVLNAVPSWRTDLKRAAGYSLVIGAVATVLLLIASTWGLRGQTYEMIQVEPALFAVVAMVICLLWAFLMIMGRPDLHYLDGGPPALVVLTVPVATVLSLPLTALWPPLLEDGAPPDVVASTIAGDPRSLILVASYLCAAYAWFAVVVVGFTGDNWKSNLAWGLALVPLLPAALFGALHVFTNPPSALSFVVWWVLAVSGLVVLAVCVTFRARRETPAR